jgi:hypothetical protein
MMRLYPFLLLLAATLSWGCPKSIEVPLPPHESRLVLNGLLASDQEMRVWLSHSLGMGDSLTGNNNIVPDARVQVFEEGVPMGDMSFVVDSVEVTWNNDTMRLEAGYYHLGYLPRPGFSYTVQASHPDYPTLEATTHLPKISADNLSFSQLSEDGITDPLGTRFSVLSFQLEPPKPTVFLGVKGTLYPEDTIIEEPQRLFFVTQLNQPRFFTSDQLFWVYEQGEREQIFFSAWRFPNGLPPFKRLVFEYQLCDSFYFTYRVSSQRHLESNFAIPALTSPAAPEPLISNVKGGYGLLGSYSVIRDTLE